MIKNDKKGSKGILTLFIIKYIIPEYVLNLLPEYQSARYDNSLPDTAGHS